MMLSRLDLPVDQAQGMTAATCSLARFGNVKSKYFRICFHSAVPSGSLLGIVRETRIGSSQDLGYRIMSLQWLTLTNNQVGTRSLTETKLDAQQTKR